MTSAIEDQIKQKEEEIQTLFDEMESQRRAFVAAATTTILGWYAEKTEEIVVSKPEITKSVETKTLQDLKRSIAQLQEDAAPIRELLEDDQLWWHKKHTDQRRSSPNTLYLFSGDRAPEVLDNPVQCAAGRLAAVLEQHGYLPTDLNFPWSGKMKAAIKAYGGLHLRGQRETSDLTKLQAQKEREETKAIWDKA